MKKKLKVVFIPVNELLPNPFQPRNTFDDDALNELAGSIKQYGILQPLCVRQRNEVPRLNINGQLVRAPGYEILAGERRWRAAKRIGLDSVPCIVMSCERNDMAYIAYTENAFREDLTFFEAAVALQDMLMMSGLTQTELAKKLSISQPSIANKIRLLKLTHHEREKIILANLTERHARAFLKVNDQTVRMEFINKAAVNNWTVQETEKRVNNWLNPPEPSILQKPEKNIRRIGKINDIGIFYNTLDNAIRLVKDVGVAVEKSERDCGDRIEIVLSIKKQPAQVNA